MNKRAFLWPALVYVIYLPFLYGQQTLYRLNPELANVYVMPVLLLVQPVLLPLAAVAVAAYGVRRHRWTRGALLAALWAIAIEFLFSLRLNPFAAVAEINR